MEGTHEVQVKEGHVRELQVRKAHVTELQVREGHVREPPGELRWRSGARWEHTPGAALCHPRL